MTGKPIFFASTRAVSASGMMSEPGVMGTPLAMAVARAVALSPIMRDDLGGGADEGDAGRLAQISAKRAFSERNP